MSRMWRCTVNGTHHLTTAPTEEAAAERIEQDHGSKPEKIVEIFRNAEE